MNVIKQKISCKQAVDFISKKEEHKLSTAQRFALWRHLAQCSLCCIFSMQNKMIIKAMAQQEAGDLTPPEKESIIRVVLQAEQ